MELRLISPETHIVCPKIWKRFLIADVAGGELCLTGLGVYRAYLNGKRIGRDYLTPGFNDYDAYLRYQTYDVTDLLAQDNLLEVYLGDGWYKGRIGWAGKNRKGFDTWGEEYLLGARLSVRGQDGAQTVIETDESWTASPSVIRKTDIYDGEYRDDTADDLDVCVPCRVVEKPYHLVAQFSPPIRERAVLTPELIVTPRGEQVLDFKQNMAGVFRFVNRLPRGGKVYIQTGEVLQQGCFYRDNLRSALSEYTYVSDGVEKEVEPWFTFYGFRYMKVEGIAHVDPADFRAVALCSDLREVMRCETGHALINQLMHNTLWGQRSNFLDTPTDCPQRDERLGWTGDTQVFCSTACYQMDCKDFYCKYMHDLRADQTMYYGGNIPQYSPSLKCSDKTPGGAVWSDVATIVPWTVYMHYGDRALLEESYPLMRDYAEKLIRLDDAAGGTHLNFPYHTYGDWLAQDGLTPQSVLGGTLHAYIQGVYYMYSLRLTAKAAQELDKTQDAARYADLAGQVHRALLDEYVSPNGNLTVDTQTAYVLALRYGIYRDKDKLIQGLRRRLRRDFYAITGGFTGAPLTIPVLMENGLADEAYRMLLNEGFPGWLYSVKLGATTIWERWNSLEADGTISGTGMNSLNHYAYGTICEAIYAQIAGLQYAAPGWKRARIAPHPDGRIGHIDLAFQSPSGEWRVHWDVDATNELTLCVQVPQGAEAEICLPDSAGAPFAVKSGAHEFKWRPERDYAHPFTGESLLMDVIRHAAAREVLTRFAPRVAALSPDARAEEMVSPAWDVVPRDQRKALDEALRAVTI